MTKSSLCLVSRSLTYRGFQTQIFAINYYFELSVSIASLSKIERGDHERVSDFHYGEKEMRRKNRLTAPALRFFLTLYWLLSGYGERYLRPLISAAVLLVVSTFLYLTLGLHPKGAPPLVARSASDWLEAIHYSFRVMTLLKPDDLIPEKSAQWINTVQSIFGPVLLGLFVLALRQRLKR
jgi:hypothetical protein